MYWVSVKIKGEEIKTKQAKNKFIKKRTQNNINSCSKNKKKTTSKTERKDIKITSLTF